MTDAIGAVPEGTLLLHIGPPKTGTSTVQAAFHRHRRDILAQGVRYAGRVRHSGSAILAVTGRRSFDRDTGAPPISRWNALVREITTAREPRVVLSSEFLANARTKDIERILTDLDAARVHVVVTLRPLSRLIASQWQQYVQGGQALDYDDWLRAQFDEPERKVNPTFWLRHRHDELVERWAAAVGPDRVTVVVLDDRDHGAVLRTFERLTGLREGTLTAPVDRMNRSLTLPEVEAIRAFNVRYHASGLGNALYHGVMHFGAGQVLKSRVPGRDEPRIETPRWALERSVEVAREMVARIVASGVRVVGEPDALTTAPEARPDDAPPPESLRIPLDVAVTLAMGIIVTAGGARGRRLEDGAVLPDDGSAAVALRQHPPDRLTRYLWRRMLGMAGRLEARLRRLVRRGGAARRLPPATPEPATPENAALVAALEEAFGRAGMPRRSFDRLVGSVTGAAAHGGTAAPGSPLPDRVHPAVVGDLALRLLVSTGLARPVRRRATSPGDTAGDRTSHAPRLVRVRWATPEPPTVAVVSTPRLAVAVIRHLVGRAGRATH